MSDKAPPDIYIWIVSQDGEHRIRKWDTKHFEEATHTCTRAPRPCVDLEVAETIAHQIAYAAELSLDDDDYVETCPLQLKVWKAIQRHVQPVQDLEVLKKEVHEKFCSIPYEKGRAVNLDPSQIIDYLSTAGHLSRGVEDAALENDKKRARQDF